MKIMYLGQRGVLVLGGDSPSKARERRVECLAEEMAERGHDVIVTCSFPFVSKNIRNFNGVKLLHIFTLRPEKAGGWVHEILSVLSAVIRKPDVIHIQGWKTAVLARTIKALSPRSVIVWTVDELPNKTTGWTKRVAKKAGSVCEGITVPTRQMQYLMLNYYGIKARYIADGYNDKSELSEVPLKHFGVRKGQYLVCLGSRPKNVSFVAKAYATSGSKKKVVVMAEKKGYMKRLAKKYDFLMFAGEGNGRPKESLINGSAAVVVAGYGESAANILKTMKSGKAVVAVTDPLYEETLGVSAQYVKSGDVEGLSNVLKGLAKDIKQQKLWGQKTRKRAKKYYRWSGLADEYQKIYRYPLTKLVAVDSVVGAGFVSS